VGLDTVELVLAVEDAFDVHLEDDFFNIQTVGDLHQVICSHHDDYRRLQAAGKCPSTKPFLATRDALLSLSAIPSRVIRPNALLKDLIARRQRRTTWEALQSQTMIQLPPLVLPELLAAAIWSALGIMWLAGTYYSAGMYGAPSIAMGIFIGTLLIPSTHFVTRPFAVAFPDSCRTVRDVVRHARPPAYPFGSPSAVSRTSDDIWDALVAIVSEQLDVPISEIHPHSRFVEDLKCD